MRTFALKLPPLAAWLILAGALATLFPLRLEHIEIIFALVTLSTLPWLPRQRRRSTPFLLFYVAFAILALKVPLPLPNSGHPVARLLFIMLFWALSLIIPQSILIYYLFRTAGSNHARQHPRQRHGQ